MAEKNGQPIVLGPGRHAVNDPLFNLIGRQNYNGDFAPDLYDYDPIAKPTTINALTIARVPKGEVGLATLDGVPLLLSPGLYIRNDPLFKFEKSVSLTEEIIQHGHITMVRVENGRIGLAKLASGELKLLSPGLHYFDDPGDYVYQFRDGANKLRPTLDDTQQTLKIGPYTRVTVDSHQSGIAHDDGVIRVLKPGERYTLEAPGEMFMGLISHGSRNKELSRVNVTTRDNVKVSVQANVAFNVDNAEFAFRNIEDAIDSNKLWLFVKNHAETTLASILIECEFNALGTLPDTEKPEESANSAESDSGRAGLTRHVHEVFMKRLQSLMHDNFGIKISSLEIEGIDLQDQELEQALSSVAKAQANKAAAVMAGEAEYIRRTKEALAEADSAKIVAQGDADAVGVRAKGQAEAIIAVARAERQAAEERNQDKTGTAHRIAETKAQGDALAEVARAGATMVVSADQISKTFAMHRSGVRTLFYGSAAEAEAKASHQRTRPVPFIDDDDPRLHSSRTPGN